MFLVRRGDGDAIEDPAGHRLADGAIAPVDRKVGRATVAAQGQESGVDQNPPMLAVVADHAGEHPDCDIVDLARAEPGLDEVAEGVDPARASVTPSSERA